MMFDWVLVACPNCRQELRIRPEMEGRLGRCKRCGHHFRAWSPREFVAEPPPLGWAEEPEALGRRVGALEAEFRAMRARLSAQAAEHVAIVQELQQTRAMIAAIEEREWALPGPSEPERESEPGSESFLWEIDTHPAHAIEPPRAEPEPEPEPAGPAREVEPPGAPEPPSPDIEALRPWLDALERESDRREAEQRDALAAPEGRPAEEGRRVEAEAEAEHERARARWEDERQDWRHQLDAALGSAATLRDEADRFRIAAEEATRARDEALRRADESARRRDALADRLGHVEQDARALLGEFDRLRIAIEEASGARDEALSRADESESRRRDEADRLRREAEEATRARDDALSRAEAAEQGRDALAGRLERAEQDAGALRAESDRLRRVAEEAAGARDEALRRAEAAEQDAGALRAEVDRLRRAAQDAEAARPPEKPRATEVALRLAETLARISAMQAMAGRRPDDRPGPSLRPRPEARDDGDPAAHRDDLERWCDEAVAEARRLESEVRDARDELSLLARDLAIGQWDEDEEDGAPAARDDARPN